MSDVKPAVLIVDDVEANLIALEAALDSLDCELVRASSGNDALRCLLKRQFAVMLLDVQMPGMDGYEVAKYARANPATRDVPIIFLTATHNTDDGVLRGYGSGAVDFLFKPVNVDILRSKVAVFLEIYCARRTLASEVAAHQRTLTALEQVNEALRHFTNAASHDLRAPLRSVQGFLEALDEQLPTDFPDDSRELLTRSRRAAGRMDSLLKSLLAYARLQKPSEQTRVKCSQILEQVKADLAETLAASGAELTVDDLPTITGEAERVYQLFLNLISNANKFRRPNQAPHIRVSSTQRGDSWEFCVADDGIGIDAPHQEQVFEAFSRLHSQSEYEGSGLGLMICKQIVEQHRGKVWLESKLGQGTKFYFSLSAAPPSA